MKRLGTALVMIGALACGDGRADLEALRHALVVEASYPEAVEIGQPLRMTFTVRNRSATPVEACLGGAQGIRVLDGAGHSATNIPEFRHLFCVSPFSLSAGQAFSLSTEFVVPSTLRPGSARIQVGIYVVNNHQCDESLGCSFTWLEAPWHQARLLTSRSSGPAAQHGVAADSPPSLSLGPLAALARLAAERPTVRPQEVTEVAIHNRYLPRWVHRIANALAAAVVLVLIPLVGLEPLPPDSPIRTACFWLLCASPFVGAAFLFVNPERLSLVRGIGAEVGYDELDPSKRPEA